MSRLAFSTSAVALALALVPTAAFADDDRGRNRDHGKGDDRGKSGAQRAGHNPPGNNGTIKIKRYNH